MNIIPAILTPSFESIQSLVESVAETTKIVQIDVCDGSFVQSKTWPYSNNKTASPESNIYVQQIIKEEIGLPNWDSVDYQFDLMITNPEKTLETWMRIGAGTVILHPTSFVSMDMCIETARQARAMSLYVGVSLTYDEWQTAKVFLTPYLIEGQFDIFQVMGMKKIGVQGEPFDDRWLDILPELKTSFGGLTIQVDGGVNEKTIDDILDTGVDTVVIGSAIFKTGNPTENLEYFKSF